LCNKERNLFVDHDLRQWWMSLFSLLFKIFGKKTWSTSFSLHYFCTIWLNFQYSNKLSMTKLVLLRRRQSCSKDLSTKLNKFSYWIFGRASTIFILNKSRSRISADRKITTLMYYTTYKILRFIISHSPEQPTGKDYFIL
jgi:hypothetical protein